MVYDLNKLAHSFDRISSYFDLVQPLFYRPYRKAVKTALQQINITGREPNVLDLGTGTGALAGAFTEYGAAVTGVDISAGMLKKAREKYGTKATFIQASALELQSFADKSFDIVSAGLVLHEMPIDYRGKVLHEMNRLSGELVFVLDYIANRNPFIPLVERIEGSYYRDFLNEIDKQLKDIFLTYQRVKINHFLGLYIAKPVNKRIAN